MIVDIKQMKYKKNNTLILGNFGYKRNQIDGQTIKTRNIFKLLKNNDDELNIDVNFFDTQSLIGNLYSGLRMFYMLTKCRFLIYLPAQNNLKYIFPVVFILSILFNFKIHYVVIGGWLNDFIERKYIHRYFLSNIAGIYPETEDLTSILRKKYNLKNVKQLYNFRLNNFTNIKYYNKKEGFRHIKLVFMARVNPMKGIFTIFELEKELEKQRIKNIFIDIYGPIQEDFKENFNKLISNSNIVEYKGLLVDNQIYDRLSEYDFMLFPTKFYTEGFPGSILDAYIAGIPVVASNWKYATEFILNNKTGLISDFNNEEKFIKTVLYLINNKELLYTLKDGVIEHRNRYSPKYSKLFFKKILKYND